MVNVKFDWSDKAIAQAAEMWRQGKSATDIASAIGASRNAVLGKMHRLRDLFPVRDPLKSKTLDATVRRKGVEQRAARKPRVSSSANASSIRAARERAMEKARASGSRWIDGLDELPKSDLSRFRLQDVHPVSFVDLERHQCRFPLECFEVRSGPQTPCCGAGTEIGVSYCGSHLIVMGRPA